MLTVNKLISRGHGLELLGTTSINLSIAGEMYANYGREGGILEP